MRLAWFSPFPPVRSGVAEVSAAVVDRLDAEHVIDRIGAREAHDFVWKARRARYDLVVYQLGNARCHDYAWAHLARYPGLVVLHDPRLHHARARQLLQSGRPDDYRREFRYDHPDAPPDFVEYAVAGLGGPIYYFWSMLRVVMRTARLVAVHNPRVADDLRNEFPYVPVEPIRLGAREPRRPGGDARSSETAGASEDSAPAAPAGARARVLAALGIERDARVFVSFGKLTAEKRIAPMLRAFAAVAAGGDDVHLVLAGDASDVRTLADDIGRSAAADRIHVTGYLPDEAVDDYLAAADACLCLRWPTALESSASWLQCLAASRATVITDLAHLADVPTLDPRTGRPSRAGTAPVAVGVDLLDEEHALSAAIRMLARDAAARDAVARAGRAYWAANHTIDAMVDDYRRAIARAVSEPQPAAADLPEHFTADYSEHARALARELGVDVDVLR